jgi:inhibitor of KinA
MNNPSTPYRIFPLGDSAITIDFGNTINESINKEVIARFNQMNREPLPGMLEAVPAYSTLTVYYNMLLLRKMVPTGSTVFEWVKEQLEEKLKMLVQENIITERLVRIPVCYENEFSPDIQELAVAKNISMDEVIEIHTSGTYKVYMIGFLPGFAYMGEVDEKITIPRKPQPQNVLPGSVGIAGKQTGIYPLASPGGWQIIGRTPLKLFDADRKEPVLLKAGDTVQFYAITEKDFYIIQNTLS